MQKLYIERNDYSHLKATHTIDEHKKCLRTLPGMVTTEKTKSWRFSNFFVEDKQLKKIW